MNLTTFIQAEVPRVLVLSGSVDLHKTVCDLTPGLMNEAKRITDFPAISKEDTISLYIASISDPDQVEFVLEATSEIRWWKALELHNVLGDVVHHVETQDFQRGPVRFTVPAGNLAGMKLVLLKATVSGIRHVMYELQNLSIYGGKSLHFQWVRDGGSTKQLLKFLRNFGYGMNAMANAAAAFFVRVLHVIAELAGQLVEAFGNVMAGILKAFGNFLGRSERMGFIFRFLFHWLAAVISAAFDCIATFLRGVLYLVAYVTGGLLRLMIGIGGGLLSSDWRAFIRGAGDFASGISGSVIAIAAKLLALIQAILLLQQDERTLTETEVTMLRQVYRKSVNLDTVRVIDGFAGLFSLNDRPFTLGNKIYMKQVNPRRYADVLVHECCHVWQNQHRGLRYISDALWAQLAIKNAYSWEEEVLRGRFRWENFNIEAQAQFLQDVYIYGRQHPSTGIPGTFYADEPIGEKAQFIKNHNDHTGFAVEIVAYVRSRMAVITGYC